MVQILHSILPLLPAVDQEADILHPILRVQTVDVVAVVVVQVELLVQARRDSRQVREAPVVVEVVVEVWGRRVATLLNRQVGLVEMEETVVVIRLAEQPM
jgi:hypothetical protein